MNINDIASEIERLEKSESNWNNVQRLSWLYTVHDHLKGTGTPIIAHKIKTATIMPQFTGEFGEVVSGVDVSGLINILSEHMAVIKILHPKEYEAVLSKIREIP